MHQFIQNAEPIKLSRLEEAVMLTMKCEARYGLQIIKMVHFASSGGEEINLGSLYPLLRRLTCKGLLKSIELAESFEHRGGHLRKYYALTSLGREALDDAEALRQKLRNWEDDDQSGCFQPS